MSTGVDASTLTLSGGAWRVFWKDAIEHRHEPSAASSVLVSTTELGAVWHLTGHLELAPFFRSSSHEGLHAGHRVDRFAGMRVSASWTDTPLFHLNVERREQSGGNLRETHYAASLSAQRRLRLSDYVASQLFVTTAFSYRGGTPGAKAQWGEGMSVELSFELRPLG